MKRLFFAAFAALLFLALCAGCGQEAAQSAGYPLSVGGVEFASSPRRVICMSRALTEDVSALGYSGRLVGVDGSSDRPSAAVRSLPKCGSVLMPDVDAMLALSPDLVLTPAPLPAAAQEALAAQGAAVVVIPYAATLDGVLSNLSALAMLFAGSEQGERLGEQLTFYADTMLDYLAGGVTSGETAVFLMRLPYTAATGDTWLNDVLSRLDLDNGAAEGGGWAYSAGEDGAYRADVLFCDESIPLEALQKSVWQNTSAVQNGRVIFLDGNVLEAQSPAFVSVLEKAVREAYPDGDFGELPPLSPEMEPPAPKEPTLWEKLAGVFH